MIACDVAPGARRAFGSERWPRFPGELRDGWRGLLEAARAAEKTVLDAPIVASDHDPRAVAIARHNAERAGVAGVLTLREADARKLPEATGEGYVVSDPPYGDRLATMPLQLAGFIRQFGEALRGLHGHEVSLLSGNELLGRNIGMRPSHEHTLFNGAIECRLYRYVIP